MLISYSKLKVLSLVTGADPCIDFVVWAMTTLGYLIAYGFYTGGFLIYYYYYYFYDFAAAPPA